MKVFETKKEEKAKKYKMKQKMKSLVAKTLFIGSLRPKIKTSQEKKFSAFNLASSSLKIWLINHHKMKKNKIKSVKSLKNLKEEEKEIK